MEALSFIPHAVPCLWLLLHRLLTVLPCRSGHTWPEGSGLQDEEQVSSPAASHGGVGGYKETAAAYTQSRAEALQSNHIDILARHLLMSSTAESRASESGSQEDAGGSGFSRSGTLAELVSFALIGCRLQGRFSNLATANEDAAAIALLFFWNFRGRHVNWCSPRIKTNTHTQE